MNALPESEIKEFLSVNLNDWTLVKNTINKDFKFKTFVEAFSFMTAIALEAENPEYSGPIGAIPIIR